MKKTKKSQIFRKEMLKHPKFAKILFVRRNYDEMGRLLYYGSRVKWHFFWYGGSH